MEKKENNEIVIYQLDETLNTWAKNSLPSPRWGHDRLRTHFHTLTLIKYD